MLISAVILTLAGLIDGAIEGYQFDGRKSFERKYNVSKTGFWGSLSWKKVQIDPNFYNKNFGVFDFYHVADDLRSYGYRIGGVLLALSGLTIENIIIAIVIGIVSKRVGLWWIRK